MWKNVIFCGASLKAYIPAPQDWNILSEELKPSDDHVLAQLSEDAPYRWLLLDKNWNPNRVREELPEVHIEIDGKILQGKITGRLNKFATVSHENHRFEFAWQTIVNCLNSDKPLKV